MVIKGLAEYCRLEYILGPLTEPGRRVGRGRRCALDQMVHALILGRHHVSHRLRHPLGGTAAGHHTLQIVHRHLVILHGLAKQVRVNRHHVVEGQILRSEHGDAVDAVPGAIKQQSCGNSSDVTRRASRLLEICERWPIERTLVPDQCRLT